MDKTMDDKLVYFPYIIHTKVPPSKGFKYLYGQKFIKSTKVFKQKNNRARL